MVLVPARVIVLAGPSGAGKSRLAQRLAVPILRLDDFYKDHDDTGLPRITEGANAGLVDWDHPASWHLDDALAAIERLCQRDRADIPVYDISTSRRTGHQVLDLQGSPRFVAEGIFAPLVVGECRRRGLLEAAYCITQHPLVTFWRRLTRDLREHRKPPLVLLRRGLALMGAQPRIVRDAGANGCPPMSPESAFRALTADG